MMRKAFVLFWLLSAMVIGTSLEANIHHANIELSNDKIRVFYTDEAVSIANYTDSTNEPTGWQLFPSIFFDSDNDRMFESNDSIGLVLSPCVHFTHGQPQRFWPLYQSVMQDPGDPHVISSGWINPNTYASKVEDVDRLITIECTISIQTGNNYFTQAIKVTSTASSTLTNANLIIYIGIDINGPFDDYAFIDFRRNDMLKAYDSETGVWFGAYPSIHADDFEVSEWNDGPYDGDDLWQNTLKDGLNGIIASSGDVEGALEFHLNEISPGGSKSLSMYYSMGTSEGDLYGPIIPNHDIAVTNVVKPKTVVGQGYNLPVNATIQNQGTYTETFNIIAYANTTTIATQLVTLASGDSTIITFTWNTTGFAKGNYTTSTYVQPVPGETDTTDNTLVDSWVCIVIPGDVNADRRVNIIDIAAIARAFGSRVGDPRYDPNLDINCDGVINIIDIAIAARNFGKTDP